MTNAIRLAKSSSIALLALLACSRPASHSAPVVARDVHPAPVDAVVGPYGACASDTVCPGPDGRCLTAREGYPGGLCTHDCVDDAACHGGVCVPSTETERVCQPACHHGSDCAAGYGCFADDRGTSFCAPLCTDDSQCGRVGCDVYTGFCGTTDTALRDDGAACTDDDQCRAAFCATETDDDGGPTGFLGGMCVSECVVPRDEAYAAVSLPRGSCPLHSVCVPYDDAAAGDVGDCLPECNEATPCRPGYACVRDRLVGDGTYTNGYCDLANCADPSQPCPAGTVCARDADGGAVGRCVRTGDAGAP